MSVEAVPPEIRIGEGQTECLFLVVGNQEELRGTGDLSLIGSKKGAADLMGRYKDMKCWMIRLTDEDLNGKRTADLMHPDACDLSLEDCLANFKPHVVRWSHEVGLLGTCVSYKFSREFIDTLKRDWEEVSRL
mmetsp:Transcript_17839/g.27575  ORF Transcript_17839/g.27575 Transcript_17839/m.27575 type:complete len:133 (-) Transcript_17839:147-545(-)